MSYDARFCLCANHRPRNKRYVAHVYSCRFIEDNVQQAFLYLQEETKWSDSNLEENIQGCPLYPVFKALFCCDADSRTTIRAKMYFGDFIGTKTIELRHLTMKNPPNLSFDLKEGLAPRKPVTLELNIDATRTSGPLQVNLKFSGGGNERRRRQPVEHEEDRNIAVV